MRGEKYRRRLLVVPLFLLKSPVILLVYKLHALQNQRKGKPINRLQKLQKFVRFKR